MSLTRCLKKLGIQGHEAAILRGATREYVGDGEQAQRAAVLAVQDALAELHEQRESVVRQVFAKGGQTVDAAAAEAEGHIASEAQQEAGNYQKGHEEIGPEGAKIGFSFENMAGTKRNPAWPALVDHYGYFLGTVGFDKDHLDGFIAPGVSRDFHGWVYVVNQTRSDGDFDEHKVIIGAVSLEDARVKYLRNYEAGWDRIMSIVPITWAGFRAWATDPGQGGPRGGALSYSSATAYDNEARSVVTPMQQELAPLAIPGTTATSFEHVVVEMEKQRTIKLPTGRIRGAEDAAQAFRQLNRSPRERFQMIGVDAVGRPVAFYDIFSGTITQTSVYPREVWTALYQTKGVKGVWFAHNHPSGLAIPSQADELLTQSLRQMLTPAVGIRYLGHLVIGGERAYDIESGGAYALKAPAADAPLRSVPVLERVIKRQEVGAALTSPGAVRDFMHKLKPTGPGVLIMDAQHRAQGWWDMTLEQMQNAATEPFGRSAADVLRLIGRNNPAAAILYAPQGTNEEQLRVAAARMKEMLILAEVKVLDAFLDKGPVSGSTRNAYVSYAERGLLEPEAPYQSGAPTDAMAIVERGPESDTLHGWRRFAETQAKEHPGQAGWDKLLGWLAAQERVFGRDRGIARISRARILTVMWGVGARKLEQLRAVYLPNYVNEILKRNDFLGFDTREQAMRAILEAPDWAERWEVTPVRITFENGDELRAFAHAHGLNIGTHYVHVGMAQPQLVISAENVKKLLEGWRSGVKDMDRLTNLSLAGPKRKYIVTVTPKYITWNYKPWDVEVLASSKAQANKIARAKLEAEGHIFTQSDAATFSAKEAPDEPGDLSLRRGTELADLGELPREQEKLLMRYEALERRVDAAYEAGDAKAEDLDAELAQLRDQVTGVGAEMLEDEADHEGEPEVDRQVVQAYADWLKAGSAQDRAYAIERAREAIVVGGGRFAQTVGDEDMLAAMHDAYMAANERRARIKASYTLTLLDKGLTPEEVRGELVDHELTRALGDRLQVIESPFQLPGDLLRAIFQMGVLGRVRGAHHDGKIYLVASNLKPGEAPVTFLHEVVGHAGVEAVLGPEFAATMREIYQRRRAEIKAELADGFLKPYRYDLDNPAHQVAAAREWIAHQAEDGKEQTLWGQVVATVRRILRRMGFVHEWSDGDVLDLMRRSRDAMVNGSGDSLNGQPLGNLALRGDPPMVREVYGVRDGRLLGMATRVGSGVWTVYLSAGTNASLNAAPGEFRRLQVGSLNEVNRIFGREGLEFVVTKPRNIPVPDRMMFDEHWVAPDLTSQADDPLGLKLKNWFARATIEFQNRLLLPRKYEETIERLLGPIPEEARAHREARLAHPRAAGLIADFTHEYVDQLADGHGNGVMERHKIGLLEAGRYLYARLAPEVNAYVESINPENVAGSGMTNERAAEIMAEFERAGRLPALEELGAIADRISHHREEVMIDKGLAKREFVELIRGRYPHYVPLREMAEDGEYINGETGSGYQAHNPIRQRFGRFSEAQSEFILPALVAQAKGTIAAGENAEVTRALLRLVEFAPNPDVWEVDRAFWKPRIDRDTGMVVWAPTPPPRGHGIRVPVGGEWHTVWVRDPALAKAFNESGVTLPDAIGFIGSITRFFATMATARNPAFLPTNLARDLQEMLIRVGGENGPKLASQALKDIPAAFWGAFSGLRAEGQYVPGESALPLAEQWHAWYRRYIEAGGHVAYRGIQDPEEQHKDFVGTLAKSGIYPESEGVLAALKHRGIHVAAVTRLEDVYQTVSNLNGAIENATRLAVFKNAIDGAGMNDKDAAMLARNATVDFNLSGEQRWINQAWMFFNANAQGTALVFRSVYHSRGVRAASAFLLVLGLMQQWFNRWWADKDPRTGRSYDEDMGEDIKQRNIVIVGPDRKNAILIPLPFAFGVFHNIGRHLMAVMPKEQGGSGESPARAAVQVFTAAVNAVSPFGNVPQSWLGSVQLISPTVGDPVVQHMTNRNWTDRPIRPERPRGASPQAASWTFFAGTPDVYVETAQWLNKLTGGNEVRSGALDFYPNVMQHWVQSIFGGAGKTYSQLFVWLGSKAAGKEVEPKDIPILNRFWYEPKDYELSRRFYENVSASQVAHFEVLRAMQRGDAEGASVMRDNFKEERSMYGEAQATESSVAKLRSEVSKIKKQPGLDDERRKAMITKLETQARDLMGGFNARFEKRTEQ
jgi:DNA repair protein RadC